MPSHFVIIALVSLSLVGYAFTSAVAAVGVFYRPGDVNVILQVEDDGSPHLYSYRPAVLEVSP